jgi:hypothetical protein
MPNIIDDDLNPPTGYGSVSLKVLINGFNLGDAWSRKTTYSKGTEHAEDAVVDLVEQYEAAVEFPNSAGFSTGLDPNILNSVRNNLAANLPNTLVIQDLTSSPCSSKHGTCKKGDLDGCAERLIELIRPTPSNGPGIRWQITITADHYYQPRIEGVNDTKGKSALAVRDMRTAGIMVNIKKP